MFIPDQFAQVNMKWAGQALPHGAQTTFAVANTLDATPDTIALAVEAAWNECNIMMHLASSTGVVGILVKCGPNDLGPAAEMGVDIKGKVVTNAVPPNTALLVRKNTVIGGHTGSGRMFIPGVTEDSSDGTGQLSSVSLGSFQSAMNTFHAKLGTSEHPMFLLHTSEAHPLGPLGVTSLLAQATLATQRRRLRG